MMRSLPSLQRKNRKKQRGNHPRAHGTLLTGPDDRTGSRTRPAALFLLSYSLCDDWVGLNLDFDVGSLFELHFANSAC
jgi:hypothetical protein